MITAATKHHRTWSRWLLKKDDDDDDDDDAQLSLTN